MGAIKVPELGESILEGTLLQWLKNVGDSVELGEAVAELETDKVNIEVMAEEAGVLESTQAEPGDTVEVGASIGTIAAGAAAGGDAGAAPAEDDGESTAEASKPAQQTASDEAGQADADNAETSADSDHGGDSGTGSSADAGAAGAGEAPATANAPDGSVPPRTTPAVRRLAKEQGVDLSNVQGSGGMGRITEEDVMRQAGKGQQPEQGQTQSASGQNQSQAQAQAAGKNGTQPAGAKGADGAGAQAATRSDERRERMSRRRQTIAKRLVEVQQQSAMLTTFNEVDMTNMLEVRKRHKDRFKEEHDIGLGFMSFFSKAAVGALKQFPRLNAEIDGQDMVLKDHYDIGIAVSTEGGLVVPVVRDVDRLTFAEIEQEVSRLAKKARDNSLALPDLQGGTFTITNGGVFGSLFSTPILNAPQVGILGMHTIQQRPVAVDGNVEIRPMMYLALSYDHRIVDGSEAVSFLVAIKKMIEDPERLLLQG